MEDMCYERRRAEACVDQSAHYAGEGERERERALGPLLCHSLRESNFALQRVNAGLETERIIAVPA